MLAAKGLFVVNIILMEKDYLFKIRLIDFETGETKVSASEFYSVDDITDKQKLKIFSEKLTNKLINNLSTNKTEKNLNKIELVDVTIKSSPKAKVFIDGKELGETPFEQKISKGIHSIKLEKEGFVDYLFKKKFSSDYDNFINLNRIIYVDVEPFDDLAYKIDGPCTIKEKKGILIVNTQYKKKCNLILANKNYKTQTINLKSVKNTLSIVLKRINKYRVTKYITPSDAKVTLTDIDGNDYIIDKSGSIELNEGKYSLLIESKDYFNEKREIILDKNIDIRTELTKAAFLKPYLSTELTISSDILYFSLGAALKVVEIGLSKTLRWGINAKLYRNLTDGYFYTDLDLNLNLNIYKKINSKTLVVDSSGDIYIAGWSEELLGGSTGGRDIFILKSNSDVVEYWRTRWGTSGTDEAKNLLIDADDNLYATGFTTGTLDVKVGKDDIFVSKINTDDGARLWTKQFGTTKDDNSKNINIYNNKLYIVGTTEVTNRKKDILLTQLDTDGITQWSKNLGTTSEDLAESLAITDGVIYVTGSTTGDLGDANFGEEDIFLMNFLIE